MYVLLFVWLCVFVCVFVCVCVVRVWCVVRRCVCACVFGVVVVIDCCVCVMLSMAVVVMSGLIVAEASLSFLGLGIQAPSPTWGNMIAEAQAGDTLTEHPAILLVPGVALFLTVFSFNLLGERAQQRWDPRRAAL